MNFNCLRLKETDSIVPEVLWEGEDYIRKQKSFIKIAAGINTKRKKKNAASFEKQGFSYVIKEEELTSEKLLAAITSVDENKETYKQAMSQSNQQDAVVKVADIIEKACK